MSKMKEGLSKDEVKLLKRIFWRSQNYAIAWCYSRMCGTSVAWVLYPFINWLYPKKEQKEKKVEALTRETAFFNMTPQISPFCFSIFASMEKEAAENEDFDVSSINAIKASIQGPLAGIGDSLFWVTWRLIVTGIALPYCLAANPIGPILFFLGFNIPSYIVRYYLTFAGYKAGTTLISNAYESGLIQLLTKTAATIGLIMIGGMVASQVSVPLNVVVDLSGAKLDLAKDVFNGIVPGFLELTLTMAALFLIKKKTNILLIILGIFAISILGAYFGVFAQ
jgi:mannose/fructose/N-acetylgalactosamine-specific phosphotransferase system component IID